MKILLLGKNGQVGWELQRALAPLGEVIALDRHGVNSWCGDMSQPDAIYQTVIGMKPDVVVNASAYTAVDLAETETELADIINHQAVQKLAQACSEVDSLLVHYSTDYVFNGLGQIPFNENDNLNPVNTYGKTKAAGENAIKASDCRYLILRTSWVYAAKGKNFLKTMLMLGQQRETLSIIHDQIGAPTSAELIADITAHAINQVLHDAEKLGVYHLVASGETSWYEYANFIFTHARLLGKDLKLQHVKPITSSEYPTPATRPLNSRLRNEKLQRVFNLHLPHWQEHVRRTLTELID